MFCRVCGKSIGELGWARHTQMHKEDFCRKFGLDPKEYYEVDWENVVKVFNPSKSKKDVKDIKTDQKTLFSFGMKAW